MRKDNIFIFSLVAVIISISIFLEYSYAEETQPLQIEIKYTNGDRIDAYQTKYIIYQDDEKSPYLEKTLDTNPETIMLPENHQYKIEVYVNGMYSEVGYIQLQNQQEKLDIHIPLPGGLKFNVFYEDGETPIEDATVIIKSQDEQQQRIGKTNENGETMRYWLQSTTVYDNYYVVEIYFDDFLLSSTSNIKLQPGLSQDKKITVPIPSIVEDLITFKLFDTESNKILKQDGDFSVLLVDKNDQKYIEHIVGARGEIYFSSLPSGIYSVSVLNGGVQDASWEKTNIIISGNQKEFDLIQENPISPSIENNTKETQAITHEFSNDDKESIFEPIIYQKPVKKYHLSCNCVAFRFDGLQDYWLNEVQWNLIELFSKNNVPLTAGVIIDSFGDDPYLLENVRNEIKAGSLEIANHGLDSTPFTVFDKSKQDSILKESTQKIQDKLDVKTTIFIPPENRFNDDTRIILQENGYTHLSASMFSDSEPFPLKDESLFRFPAIASTGEYVPSQNRILGIPSEKTFSEALNGINKYGFAVITVHPQEFSAFRGGEYVNEINPKQIEELSDLIQKIKDDNIKIVRLGSINQQISVVLDNQTDISSKHNIPTWIKNSAGWWRDGFVDDDSFIQSIQYLINENILQIPQTTQGSGGSEIPSWIKENAGWWAEGKISDDDFIYGVSYLVNHGIIIVDI